MATYAAKGEQSPDARDGLTAAKLSCVAGLAALDAKKYRAAAKRFSEARSRAGIRARGSQGAAERDEQSALRAGGRHAEALGAQDGVWRSSEQAGRARLVCRLIRRRRCRASGVPDGAPCCRLKQCSPRAA